VEPPATGPPAGSLSYPDPKIKILNEAQRPSQTSHQSRRMIKASGHSAVQSHHPIAWRHVDGLLAWLG
jgi:hypothetical protein